ncbi:hypothetical protein K438DRAFT_1989582 [Mycena galopus ATCC 62051]|nr:hypothetical protein K438DRAFT_1989582 [Mycena galopus ATCC 62051]
MGRACGWIQATSRLHVAHYIESESKPQQPLAQMMHERENGDPFSVPVSHPYATRARSQSVDAPYLAANSNAFLAPDAYRDDPGAAPSYPLTKGRGRYIAIGLAAVLVVAAAVVLPIYFLVIKKHYNAAAKSANGTSSGLGGVIVMENRASFVYNNSFGEYWRASASNPFLDGAKPNSWTPALNESWTWGQDRVYSINLGGVITPALFQAYPSAPDEWTLATLMRADGTLEATMEVHYDTFITEQDIAQIAGAGLNWVRVPIPFWAIRCVALLCFEE